MAFISKWIKNEKRRYTKKQFDDLVAKFVKEITVAVREGDGSATVSNVAHEHCSEMCLSNHQARIIMAHASCREDAEIQAEEECGEEEMDDDWYDAGYELRSAAEYALNSEIMGEFDDRWNSTSL